MKLILIIVILILGILSLVLAYFTLNNNKKGDNNKKYLYVYYAEQYKNDIDPMREQFLKSNKWKMVSHQEMKEGKFDLLWHTTREYEKLGITGKNLKKGQVLSRIVGSKKLGAKRYLTAMINNIKDKDTSFYPKTFQFNEGYSQNFLKYIKDTPSHPWIIKGVGQSKGTLILKDHKALLKVINEDYNKTKSANLIYSFFGINQDLNKGKYTYFIYQKYIHNPLLLDNKKFDVRIWCLVSECNPDQLKVYYRDGFVRKNFEDYSDDFENKVIHLTNSAIQKTSPKYNSKLHDRWSNRLSFADLNTYLNTYNEKVPKNWVEYTLKNEIKKILVIVFEEASKTLGRYHGTFHLYAIDIMVDENLKVYLCEFNNTACLKKSPLRIFSMDKLISDTLDIVLNANNLIKNPNEGEFELIYDEKNNWKFSSN